MDQLITEGFEISIEQMLAPSLQPGQIVIRENLSIQKGKKVRQLIQARGSQVLFLPAYSPDLSPIEEAFSKSKDRPKVYPSIRGRPSCAASEREAVKLCQKLLSTP